MTASHSHASVSTSNPWRRVIPFIEQLALDHGGPIIVANDLWCLEDLTERKGGLAQLPIGWDQGPTLWLHMPFENVPAVVSGAEAIWKNRRKMKETDDRPHKMCALCGPGVAYDKMFQSVSGLLERWHDVVLVCFDDHVRADVHGLHSSAMPRGAATQALSIGKNGAGRVTPRKDMTYIALMHHIPFAGQTTLSRPDDFEAKLQTAFAAEGPAFLDVLVVGPEEWDADPDRATQVLELAIETNYWPLYEAAMDRVTINHKPQPQRPIADWLHVQQRFAHLFHQEHTELLAEIQGDVDQRWKELLALEAASAF